MPQHMFSVLVESDSMSQTISLLSNFDCDCMSMVTVRLASGCTTVTAQAFDGVAV